MGALDPASRRWEQLQARGEEDGIGESVCGEVSLPVIRGVWLAFFLDGIYCVQRVTVLAIVVYFVGDFECTLVRSMYLAKFDS